MKTLRALLLATTLVACDDDGPSGPRTPDVDARGNYSLTELTFDPQGSLPQVDLRARTTSTIPRLVLVSGGRAQLVFEDPATGLVSTADADYTITSTGDVSIEFTDASNAHRGSFLSKRMTFTYDATARTLTFAGTPTEGIERSRLLALVPEWQDEQLFDPVPGTLRVVYRASATS